MPIRLQRALTIGKQLGARLGTARTLGVAAEMAFWLFLSLLPLAAVGGLIVAKFASTDATFASTLFESLPRATHDLVARELGSMSAWNGGRFGVAAAVMFLWLASSGIAALFEGIELQTESKPRSWWVRRALALAVCLGLSLGIAALALLGAGVGALRTFTGDDSAFASSGWTTVRLVVGASLAFALLSGLYYVAVPKDPSRRAPLLPGAILAFLVQTIAGFGYTAYLATLGDGGAYQGGLASIGVTMMGLYILCIALLVGAELNQWLAESRVERAKRAPIPAPLSASRQSSAS